jgi:hypothetical protein
MGSHGYSPAHWRDVVDRWSFENGERIILFRPTAAREQGSTVIVVCAQANSGNFGRHVARPNIWRWSGTHFGGAEFMRVIVPAPSRQRRRWESIS